MEWIQPIINSVLLMRAQSMTEGRGGEGRGACRSLSDSMRGLQNVVRPHALQDPVDTKKIMCLATPVLCPLMLQAPL